jgi:Uma2 family endonuclease
MRAVWIDVPEWFLEERRRLGHDRKDELWDGVLHMVPPGSFAHGSVIGGLTVALDAIARRRGMRAYPSELGVFEHDTNYRVPDITIVRPEHCTERGLIGAELVVEVLSPHDESREKQPFYAARGIRESWIVAPRTRVVEMSELREEQYVRIDGHRSPTFGIDVTTIETPDGPRIHICDGEHLAEV